MKVLIAARHRDIVGGAETHLKSLVPLLRSAGHEVGVLFERDALPGASVIIGHPDPASPTWWVRAPGALAGVDAWRPDVVYCQGMFDYDLEADLTRRYPTVLFCQDYHGACVSGTKCHSRRGYRNCDRVLGPGCLPRYMPWGCGGLNPVIMMILYRRQMRRQKIVHAARAVVVASRHMVAEYRRQGVPAERLHLAPLFAPAVVPDPDPPAPRERSHRLLFAGRLTRLKGGDHLIEALARMTEKQPTLVVAGVGPQRKKLERLAKARGVPADFLGWVGGADLAKLTRGVDLIAAPSLWPEPFGLVGIEAGCVGVPCVGYANGGIRDWLIPGVSGESAPGEQPDPTELAAALDRAVADDAHWQRLRVGAWETAKRFSPEAHLRALEGALQAAVG